MPSPSPANASRKRKQPASSSGGDSAGPSSAGRSIAGPSSGDASRKRIPSGAADADDGAGHSSARARARIDAERKRLPMWEVREAFLQQFAAGHTLVLCGETGCGKTTQIPQFLLGAGYARRGLIGITQPRRVAAISVASRVAAELGEEVGQTCGYRVRFDECSSDATKLCYMTDGMLLREAVAAPALRRYSVVIVDEAHERSVNTDMMLALLRKAQQGRPTKNPLSLLIMSATLDLQTFQDFFGGAPACRVPGRQFPISLFYAPTPQSDYLEASAQAVMQIHEEEEAGDILVFLTGVDDIDAVSTAVKRRVKELPEALQKLAVHPLYAALPPALQMRALKPAAPGTRKVILATNIAETSLTIDGVVYVVDTGLAKVRMFHAGKRIDSLLAMPISKAQARQRAGRAGRQQAGKCFRLYTEDSFLELAERSVPEIQRTSLASSILALKALGIDDVIGFEFVSPPPMDAMVAALETLLALGALDKSGQLAADGKLMAKLPLEPAYAKALLDTRVHGCASFMLTLVAMLSVEGNAFVAPPNAREQADEARRRFTSSQADTITLVNVMAAYGNRKGSAAKAWCESHFANRRTLDSARRVREQLSDSCQRLGLLPAEHAAAEAAVEAEAARRQRMGLPHVDQDTSRTLRRCMTSAFFLNAAQRQPSGEYLALISRQPVAVHPSSALFQRRVSCVLFNELLYTTKLYMRDLTQIDADWLPELAPQSFASAGGAPSAAAPAAAPPGALQRGGASPGRGATFGDRQAAGFNARP